MNGTDTDRSIRHRIGPDGRVVFKGVDAEVRVRGTDEDEVVISLLLSGGPDDPDEDELPVRIRRGDGWVEIESGSVPGIAPGLFRSMRRGGLAHVDEVTLEVPRSAQLQVEVVSGDLDVRGTDGEQSYRTVSGDLALADVGGVIRATTVSGDLSLRGEHPAAVALSSTSGDVSVRLPWLRGSTIGSFSGDVDVDAGLVPESEHRVETISGEVALAFEGGFTAEVSSPAGELHVGLPHERRRESGRRWIRVGDGSARVSVRTMSGDVSFRPTRERRSSAPPGPLAVEHGDDERGRPSTRHAEHHGHLATPFAPAPPPPPPPPFRATPADPGTDAPSTRFEPARGGDDRQLRILRAVAAGDLDPDEAARLLEEDFGA